MVVPERGSAKNLSDVPDFVYTNSPCPESRGRRSETQIQLMAESVVSVGLFIKEL